jgi:solute carrier family 25 carnitine/acylcarnitine transporter 20/29
MTHSEDTHLLLPPPPFSDDPPLTILEDLIAGGIAGSLSVVVGHPFDTYKVRLQTSSSSPNLSAYGGISSLFRGMSAPLSTAAIVNAVCFATYAESSRVWDQFSPPTSKMYDIESKMISPSQSLTESTWFKALICGGFTGAVMTLVTCPMEHVKCRLQVQHGRGISDRTYRGPLDAAGTILKKFGFRGLYRGFVSTICREIPAIGSYFSSYDIVRDYIDRRIIQMNVKGGSNSASDHGTSKLSASSILASSLAGGVSGALSWVIVYPVDVVKSRIQTTPLDAPSSSFRLLTVTQNIIVQLGWRALFRGLGVTVIRAFPVNGVIFPIYELTLSSLRTQ